MFGDLFADIDLRQRITLFAMELFALHVANGFENRKFCDEFVVLDVERRDVLVIVRFCDDSREWHFLEFTNCQLNQTFLLTIEATRQSFTFCDVIATISVVWWWQEVEFDHSVSHHEFVGREAFVDCVIMQFEPR